MNGFLLRFLITALGLWLAASLVPGVTITGTWTLIFAAFWLGIVNAVVRPMLVFLTLPLTLITLGLFLLVINAAMSGLVAALLDLDHSYLAVQGPPGTGKTYLGSRVIRDLVEKHGWKIGDRIPIQGTIFSQSDGSRTWTFDLVGIYEAAEKGVDDTQLLFRYDYFDEARAYGRGQVGWYVIRDDDPDQAEAIAAQVDATFANSPANSATSFVRSSSSVGNEMTV